MVLNDSFHSRSIERFMYGYDLTKDDGMGEQKLKPGDLCVTYLAADKYLVEELKEELILGSLTRLNKFEVCLLFEQFLKISFDEIGEFVCKEKELILNEFKKYIQAYSEDAFGSESFTEIEEDTLIQLLRLEFLNLSESKVLNACLRWTDAEVKRQGLVATMENRQKVFSNIKPFVRLTDLDYDQLSELSSLKEVLTIDELASLHLNWTGGCDQIAIERRTERQKSRNVYKAHENSDSQFPTMWVSEFSINLRSKFKKVCITSIQTNLSYISHLELKVFKFEQKELVPMPFLEFKKYLIGSEWCFEPGRALEIDPDVSYKFVFSFSKKSFRYLYRTTSFTTSMDGNRFDITLSDFGECHCIKSLNFCQISNYENATSKSV